jgi:hypothetical protein
MKSNAKRLASFSKSNAKYYQKHREELRQKHREWRRVMRETNPELLRKQWRDWYKRNMNQLANRIVNRRFRQHEVSEKAFRLQHGDVFSVVTLAQLRCPEFIVELNGTRHRERLY